MAGAAAHGAVGGDDLDVAALARLRRARVAAVALVGIVLVVLAATGAYLTTSYRPTSAQAWGERYAALSDGTGPARTAHRWAGLAAVPLGAVAGGLVLAEAVVARGRRTAAGLGVVLGPVLAGAVALACVTGFLLPYDQLALWSVTVGSDIQGYGPVFGDEVRFALVRGAEVSAQELRARFVGHLALAGVAVGMLVLVARGPAARRRSVR